VDLKVVKATQVYKDQQATLDYKDHKAIKAIRERKYSFL
jgi:hypothetical protein